MASRTAIGFDVSFRVSASIKADRSQCRERERELAGYHCTVGSDITVLYLLRAEIHLPSSRNLSTVPYKSWTQKRLLNGLCIFQALWLPPPSREESQNQNNTAEAHRATTLKFALFSKPFLKKVKTSDDLNHAYHSGVHPPQLCQQLVHSP